MSSHHIVKEKQEPALYIHCLGDFDHEYLGQLLEWSPTLAVSANEYEKAVSLGLKIDLVFGEGNIGQLQESAKFIDSPNESILDAVKYFIGEKFPALNVISKEDHFDDFAHLLPNINLVLFTEQTKSYAVKPGFSIWKPAGTRFKIDIISYFETANLKPADDGDFVVIKDGFVSFDFTTPYLFLSEYL